MQPLRQIWFMCAGFLGIQFGFALLNSNGSAILQNLGVPVEQLSWFWLIAPILGMILQPVVGQMSDRTWTRLGRRKPYFLTASVICCISLLLLPNAGYFFPGKSALVMGAVCIMLLDTNLNLSMEPSRALIADNVPDSQRNLGFAVQTFLIGIGAVIGSWLPYILKNVFGVSGSAPAGMVADNVVYSFYIGTAVFLGAVLIPVFLAKEYPPEVYEKIHGKQSQNTGGLITLFRDFRNMPGTMRQLGLVQFFSWFAMFSLWVFAAPAIAQHIFHLPVDDNSSDKFRDAGAWVGVTFGVYNAVAAVYALIIPRIAKRLGRKKAHSFSLLCGGIGLMSIYLAPGKEYILFSMLGVGMAWGSILALPYAILAGAIPSGKMGVYMGIFNFFITFPQIVNGLFGGPLIKYLYGNQAIYALVAAGLCLVIASFFCLFVKEAGIAEKP